MALAMACVLNGLGCGNSAGNASSQIAQPLLASSNPNYFQDANGTVLALNGSHTWNNLQDWGSNGAPQAFDFNAYVSYLQAHGNNLTLLWRTELPKFCGFPSAPSPADLTVSPHPWQRTGPGVATRRWAKIRSHEIRRQLFCPLADAGCRR